MTFTVAMSSTNPSQVANPVQRHEHASTFQWLLSERDPDRMSPSMVAGRLRSTGASLAELGVQAVIDPLTGLDSWQWSRLRRCVQEGGDDDTLTVFQVMVAHLEGFPMIYPFPP